MPSTVTVLSVIGASFLLMVDRGCAPVRRIADADLGAGSPALHDGDVVDPDVLLDGVVLVARRGLARRELDIAGVAGAQLALAGLDVPDRRLRR